MYIEHKLTQQDQMKSMEKHGIKGTELSNILTG